MMSDERMWVIAPISVVDRLKALRQVYVSEIANPVQPPERITYEIKHKYPNEATLKAVRMFEEKMVPYLCRKDWGYVGGENF